MPINLRGFGGEIPRLQPRYLPDQAATTASDLRLARGDLEPIHEPSAAVITAPGNREAIYRSPADEWLFFTDATTRVVPGPVADDRLYIASEGAAPKIRISGGTEYPLALPAPGTPPVLTRASGTLDPELQELVLYCYTFVTSLGEESRPSPPTGIYWSPGCVITVGSMATPPAGRGISKKRIYRSQTATSGATEFFFVDEIVGSNVTYNHDLEAAPVQEAIPSMDFNPPPAGLRNLTSLPNGIMAASDGKELLFCEPYQPHAWPVKYRQTVTDQIVGLAAFGSSLAVLTTGQPWIAQGLHPEQMVMEKMEQPFPCLASLGVVDMGYSAVFPSTDGLVEVTQGGARMLTESILTREQWDAMAPASFRAAAWGGRYVVSYLPVGGASRKIAVFDPRANPPSLIRSGLALTALHNDLASGNLFALAADKRSVVRFDAPDAARRAYSWVSKPWYSGMPTSYGAAFVEAPDVQAGSSVTIRGDGNVIATIPHTAFNSVVRLPAKRVSEWQIEAAGTSIITRITVATHPGEVRQ